MAFSKQYTIFGRQFASAAILNKLDWNGKASVDFAGMIHPRDSARDAADGFLADDVTNR